MTVEERILLYLSEYKGMEEEYELPCDLTQKHIAYGVKVQRKHISRYLKRLIEGDLVAEKRCRIKGMKQRMKAYYLTWSGLERGKRLRRFVSDVTVKVKADKVRPMKIGEIDSATSVHLTLSDIVREAIEKSILDMGELERIEDKKRMEVDRKHRKSEIYSRALAAAWMDGYLTSSEQHLLDSLKTQLKISDDVHRKMESEILERLNNHKPHYVDIYMDVLRQAWLDEPPVPKEMEMMEVLRHRFGISEKEHKVLEKEILGE